MSSAEPPSRSPRQARKFAAKREAVLDAALSIVIEDGLAGLTLGKVAKALDVAVGGLYRYVPSKEALITALQQRAVSRFGERLRIHLERPAPADAVAHLRRVVAPFAFYVRSREDARDDHRLMDVMLSSLDPSISEAQAREVEEVLGPILAVARAGLEAAADAGALDPGDARARTLVLWGATHGLGHLRSRDRLESAAHRVDALYPVLFGSLLRGFGADAAEVEAAVR
ncbi:MAG: TetR/AcrR family transcriptional regulator [Myxococcota bacterium]